MNTLFAISPELILLAGMLVIIVLDFLAGRTKESPYSPGIALTALIAALIASLFLLGAPRVYGRYFGMIDLDPFSIFFKIIATLSVILVVLAADSFMKGKTPYPGEFYALLLAAAMAVMVTASANTLVMVYLGLEFLSITSYILAGFLREDRFSNEAAIKYFLYGAIASAVMLYGFSLLYGLTGQIYLTEIAKALGDPNANPTLRFLGVPAIVLILFGFGFKIALVPFHQWSPDAYQGAPTPITAFLSTASTAAGFAVITRVFLVALPGLKADWTALLIGISMITMTVGNILALRQRDIKRLLAYSSIAQSGYILMGLVSTLKANPSVITGQSGILLYIFAYLFTQLGAFLVVMAVEERIGSNDISDYRGLLRRSPFLASALLIFLLSLTGIPATGGFWGKAFVFGAAVQQALLPLAVVAIINSVIAAYYYLSIVRLMFFDTTTDSSTIPVASTLRAALLIAAVLTIVIGVYPQPFINFATTSVQMLNGQGL